MTVAAPPSPQVLPVLTGLLRDAALLVGRGTATRADVDTAMRLGAGHPGGPFEVLAALPPEERQRLGLALPENVGEPAAAGTTDAPAWTGPVGVAGTGHMAAGIVEAVARSGRPVRVLARSSASGERLLGRLAASLDRAAARGKVSPEEAATVLARVSVTEQPADLTDSDVVEAVAEDLTIKAQVLAAVDTALPPSVPVATNTSSFRVADLRPHASPDRAVLALHFFNPAQVMKLVEVVVPDDVADADRLRAAATAWARALGKTPVTCANSRGFVINRLLVPFLNDAVRLHEGGLSVAEVDALLTEGAGHPMGPLALIDLIGLDVTVAALESMAAVEDDPRLVPARTLHELVTAGRLGRKAGTGFHPY